MISYIDYINRLNELDIKLFDFQRRISYSRLSNLKYESLIQTGGSSNSIIYKLGKIELENIIVKLLNKEYENADTICKIYGC
jgi:hypothetical protein